MPAPPEVNGHSWAKQTSWLLAANVFRNVGFVAVLVLLAQLTTPETVGKYALALAITMPIFVLAQMALKNLYLTNHATHPFRSYHALQSIAMVLAIPVSVGVAAIVNSSLVITVLLVSLLKANDVWCELYAGSMQEFGRSHLVLRGYLTQAVFGTAAVTVILVLTKDMNLALLGLVVMSLGLTAWLMLVPALSLVKSHETESAGKVPLRSDMWAIAKLGLPQGAGLAIFTLVLTIPQYVLAATKGDAAVGYFATVIYALAVVDLFLNTLTQGWIPRARQEFWKRVADKTSFAPYVAKTFSLWTLIFVPLTLVGLVALYFLMPIIFGHDYTLTLPVAIALGVCVLVSPSQHFGSVGMTVLNFYNRGLIPNITATSLTLVTCVVAIPAWGPAGALAGVAVGLVTKAVVALILMGGVATPRQRSSEVPGS